MTTLSLPPLRWSGLSRGGARIVVFLLAIATLSIDLPGAAAGDPTPPKKTRENPYAVIFGTVWGPDDKAVFGVKVKIRRQNERKARWEVISDHNGEFAQRVPAGKADYVAWADLKGYKSITGNRLRSGDQASIHVDYDERVDTGLHLK